MYQALPDLSRESLGTRLVWVHHNTLARDLVSVVLIRMFPGALSTPILFAKNVLGDVYCYGFTKLDSISEAASHSCINKNSKN